MSTVYNPEADRVAEIERLELEAREIRRKMGHVANDRDRAVLNRQLEEIREQIKVQRAWLTR
jgi:hypothetical protein